MKLPRLIIDLSLILILTSRTKGQTWDINVTRSIRAAPGSNVTVPCSFTYPRQNNTKDVIVYWKKQQRSEVATGDADLNAFVFHTNANFVLKKYRGKTKLIGNKNEGNCTLVIQDIRENEPRIYMRLIASGIPYSFYSKSVSITLSGENETPGQGFTLSPTLESSVTVGPKKLLASTYAAIFIPIIALLVIFFGGGICFRLNRKRTMSLTREDSGYYANFSGTSSNQAKRDATFQKQENKKLSEVTAVDEPVYINVEVPPAQMDEIYENVFYSK